MRSLVVGLAPFALALVACESALQSPAQPRISPGGPHQGRDPGRGSESGGGGTRPGGSMCDADALAQPLTRLSRDELQSAYRDLLGGVVDQAANAFAAIPRDDPPDEEAFSREDQRISERHVDQWFRVAERLAQTVAQSPDARERALGACARTAADEACLRSALPDFLSRALRRPATTEDVDRVVAMTRGMSPDEAIEVVVFAALMAPEMHYRFENRGTVSEGVAELTDFELANRLSFHFWGAPPDDELRAAAAAGELSTEAGFRAQVDRLFEDPRTEETLLDFFFEWFHLDRGTFSDSPRLAVLAEGIDTTDLAAAMKAEVMELIRHHLRSEDLGWTDVLTSDLSFATDPRVADIYGVAPWDGVSSPPQLDPSERAGLLTRAGMLYTPDGSTNPFRRGAFLRRNMLCGVAPPPPTDLPPDALEPPETTPGTTTREAFEALVADEPCAGCHLLFSDLGYGLEAYDGLGRFRSTERLVTTLGEDEGTAPIDSVVVPRIDMSDDRPTSTAVEMMQRIAEGPEANACLAERYLQFTLRRHVDSSDRCVTERVARALEEGESLRDALKSVALDPTFRHRAVTE